MVFEESIRHPDVREIGGEWLCRQALEQLKLADFLVNTGFTEEEAQLALTQIIFRLRSITIARAVYPASEWLLSLWSVSLSNCRNIGNRPMDT